MSILRVKDAFDDLRLESEQSRKEVEVTSNPALTFLAELYEQFCLGVPEYERRSEHIDYNEHACSVISTVLDGRQHIIKGKDLEYLLMVIPSYHRIRGRQSSIESLGGTFANACINYCVDKDIILCPGNLDFNELGTYNDGKNILVRGNVGSGIGTGMRAGQIDVFGYAKGFLGNYMHGGEIVIRGDVKGVSLGHQMKGGVIRVKGNVIGNLIGDAIEKSNGTIYVEGEMEPKNISCNMRGGTLYHKGKIIRRNGVEVK